MMDSVFLEKIIVKGMLEDKQFLVLISQVYEKEYFDNGTIGEVFEVLKDHLENYNKIPPKDVIINSVNDKKDVKSLFEELDCIDYDTAKNYDHLLKESNIYLKEQAVKIAIMESANIIDEKGDKFLIRSKVEDALCKDLLIDLGLRYLGDMGTRLKKMFNTTDIRVPTYFPTLDEMINGGFPPLTLSIFASRIHGFKCVNPNTIITIRNKKTGNVKDTRFQDFYKTFDTLYEYPCKENKNQEENEEMLNLQGMIKKYGEEEGTERYNTWKRNISKSSKGRNTKKYFIKKYGEKEGIERHKSYIDKQKKYLLKL